MVALSLVFHNRELTKGIGGGEEVLPYMGYIGLCGCNEYGF